VIPSAQRRKRKASWYAGVDCVFGIMELRAGKMSWRTQRATLFRPNPTTLTMAETVLPAL
jgi:hypothetical protein